MTLRIEASVNRERIATIDITNTGHPDTGRFDAHDDTRRYHWTLDDGTHDPTWGHVTHRRSEGWQRLLAAVLTDIETHHA